jgi:surface protein
MFAYAQALTALDLNSWDMSNVTDISYMFYECQKLTSLQISEWDVSNV